MSDTQTWKNFLSIGNVLDVADIVDKTSLALQSQYSHAKRFRNLGEVFQGEIDASEQLDDLHAEIADTSTAEGVFLDWWGQRIGVDRFIKVNGQYQRFDDDYFRFLLQYRALCNIANSTAATMNRNLSMLTSTRVFVVDYGDMTLQSIVFIGDIPDLQAQILQNYGLLNRPAGVLTNFLIIYPDEQIFGFNGSELKPFGQGVFNPGRTIGM